MHRIRNASGVMLSVAALSLAGLSAASAHISNDGCVPPGLFEPTGLIEPANAPEADTPGTDGAFGRIV